MKTKLIVIGEHTLGYIPPDLDVAFILHASVLKQSPYVSYGNPANFGQRVGLAGVSYRLASEKDFDEYGVSFEGFKQDAEHYEYE